MGETFVSRAATPSAVQFNGVAATDGMSLHVNNEMEVSAEIRPLPDTGSGKGDLRMVVRIATNKDMVGYAQYVTAWGGRRRATYRVLGLQPNTRYWVQVLCKQRNVPFLSTPVTTDVWTERYPLAPLVRAPLDNQTFDKGSDILVAWTHRDPDVPADAQARAQVRYRTSATPVATTPGPWQTITYTGLLDSTFIDGANLRSNTSYDLQIRTSDVHHPTRYGPWSGGPQGPGGWVTIYVIGSTTPPLPLHPVREVALAVDQPVTFEWAFRDIGGKTQVRADLRVRRSGEVDWTVATGTATVPGAATTWTFGPGVLTFLPGYQYEWQVRTISTGPAPDNVSDWSKSSFFWAITSPGSAVTSYIWDGPTEVQGALGCGEYRVFAFDRGGTRQVGEILPINVLRWNRVRDDISTATIYTSGFGEDCCGLLGSLRTWAHEIVIFRNGERVWEGPITRLAYHRDHVEIEARDPMVYLYRRIMRQGYNDNFQRISRKYLSTIERKGARSVVDRAAIIITNALAYDDPNILPWLVRLDQTNDAKESRVVPDWSKTAWEEVDSLAATAGLDYTVVGRSIILNDTHNPVGRIPEMREKDFFDPPVITEYGMNAANVFGVTSNSGIWGSYEVPRAEWGGLGFVEQIASEYGESGAGTGSDPEAMTEEDKSEKREILNEQAKRNQSGRWPAPVVARVPDNSRIHPEANVGINQLVPGVWVPLRVTTICREFAQMQKIDSISVEVADNADEAVKITMSPAPRSREDDPDDGAEGEAT